MCRFMAVVAQFTSAVGKEEDFLIRRMRRVTSDASQVFLCTRVDDPFPHWMKVCLGGITVTGQARAHNIRVTE